MAFWLIPAIKINLEGDTMEWLESIFFVVNTYSIVLFLDSFEIEEIIAAVNRSDAMPELISSNTIDDTVLATFHYPLAIVKNLERNKTLFTIDL